MFNLKNGTYNGTFDPTANRLAALNEMGKLKIMTYEERLKTLSSSGFCSFNWVDRLLKAAGQ